MGSATIGRESKGARSIHERSDTRVCWNWRMKARGDGVEGKEGKNERGVRGESETRWSPIGAHFFRVYLKAILKRKECAPLPPLSCLSYLLSSCFLSNEPNCSENRLQFRKLSQRWVIDSPDTRLARTGIPYDLLLLLSWHGRYHTYRLGFIVGGHSGNS